MTTVKDIYSYIDSFAPFDSAEEWDNVGILVGDKNAQVTKALLSLDITNGVADEAHALGAQLIISHHPVIFGGIKRVLSDSPVYRAAALGLSCLCAHTNLDKSPVFGVNTALAKASGLVGCEASPSNELLFVAKVEQPVTARQFAETLKDRLKLSGFSYTPGSGMISKVGLCSGGGGSEIFSAAKEGCDAFITGEIKHHELLFANEAGISVFTLGHYRSEDVVIKPLGERLAAEFPDVEFITSSVFTDEVMFIGDPV